MAILATEKYILLIILQRCLPAAHTFVSVIKFRKAVTRKKVARSADVLNLVFIYKTCKLFTKTILQMVVTLAPWCQYYKSMYFVLRTFSLYFRKIENRFLDLRNLNYGNMGKISVKT